MLQSVEEQTSETVDNLNDLWGVQYYDRNEENLNNLGLHWEDQFIGMQDVSGETLAGIGAQGHAALDVDLGGSLGNLTTYSAEAFGGLGLSFGEATAAISTGSSNLFGSTLPEHYNTMTGAYDASMMLITGAQDTFFQTSDTGFGGYFGTGGIIPSYYQQNKTQYGASLNGMSLLTNSWMNTLDSAVSSSVTAIFKGGFDSLGEMWQGVLNQMLTDLIKWGANELSGALKGVFSGIFSGLFGEGGGSGGGGQGGGRMVGYRQAPQYTISMQTKYAYVHIYELKMNTNTIH